MVSIFPFFFFLSNFDNPASIKKIKEQNETHQANRTRMAEGLTLALEKKDQVNASLYRMYCLDLVFKIKDALLSVLQLCSNKNASSWFIPWGRQINRDIEFKNSNLKKEIYSMCLVISNIFCIFTCRNGWKRLPLLKRSVFKTIWS